MLIKMSKGVYVDADFIVALTMSLCGTYVKVRVIDGGEFFYRPLENEDIYEAMDRIAMAINSKLASLVNNDD